MRQSKVYACKRAAPRMALRILSTEAASLTQLNDKLNEKLEGLGTIIRVGKCGGECAGG